MRLFFGLSLPDEIRSVTASLAEGASAFIPGRYALPENHHITLAFIGEVSPERLPEAREILARCAARFPAPRITIGGFSHFGKAENGILILSVQSEPALAPLNTALREALSRANLPFDPGPFSPHVTLARHADVTGGYPADTPLPAAFTAARASLFLSARDDAGVLRYTPLFDAQFSSISPEADI